MSDVELGGADVNLDALNSGAQIEEWVPLRAGKDGITWYVANLNCDNALTSFQHVILTMDSALY